MNEGGKERGKGSAIASSFGSELARANDPLKGTRLSSTGLKLAPSVGEDIAETNFQSCSLCSVSKALQHVEKKSQNRH